MKKRKIFLGVGLLLGVGFALVIRAQLNKPKVYEPTEVQNLRLQLRQKDAQIALQRFQATVQDMNTEAEKIKKENSWPADLKFNGDTLKFEMPTLPLPSPAPAPNKKP
jgi:Tfp pilus assembly protein PilO